MTSPPVSRTGASAARCERGVARQRRPSTSARAESRTKPDSKAQVADRRDDLALARDQQGVLGQALLRRVLKEDLHGVHHRGAHVGQTDDHALEWRLQDAARKGEQQVVKDRIGRER